MSKFKIIYDENCSFCVWLGEMTKKNTGDQLELMSYSQLIVRDDGKQFLGRDDLMNLPSIAAIDGNQVFFHEEAWDILTENYPGLSSLHWLAEKVGVRKTFVKGVKQSAHSARYLCSRCPRPFRKKTL